MRIGELKNGVVVYREMTAEEMEQYRSDPVPESITMDDVLEILADQEYRICLMELGVMIDDL